MSSTPQYKETAKRKPLRGVRIKKSSGSYKREEYFRTMRKYNKHVELNKLPKNKKGKPYSSVARMKYYLTISGRLEELNA